MEEMVSQKVLQEWCRVTCASYPGVEIKDLSTSFRDGLAFCAIIHKHRPDLINFRYLSKEDAYGNNKLAFEVAETKLGIPALLYPKDMLSSKGPDCLSVITYLSQYYDFFNRKTSASPVRLRSSHVTVINGLPRSKTSDGLKRQERLTDLETGEENQFLSTRPLVCHLCFKPVHLIQRHLVDGKVFHHSCFRCKVCCSSLLPDSYIRGSDPDSLMCSDHIAASKSTCVDLNQEIASPNMENASYSLRGLAISNVPHYAKITESQDRPVSGTATRGGSSSVGAPLLLRHGVEDRKSVSDGKASQDSTGSPAFHSAQAAESRRPVPAPRRLPDSSGVPVPAARIKTSPTMNTCPPAGGSASQSKSSPSSSHMSRQTATSPKVKTNHPWMTILHPGPWTQLPPAPPPVPRPRSKTVAKKQTPWNQPKPSPPNPFEEEEEEEAPSKLESGTQTEPSMSADVEKKEKDLDTVIYATVNKNRLNPFTEYGEKEFKPQSKPTLPKRPVFSEAAGVAAGSSSEADLLDATEAGTEIYSNLKVAQKDILSRSVSVPAISSDRSASASVSLTSCQSKQVCKENPFDRKPAMTKSKTVQELSSSRSPAPGHGFPLIKRKVQTDQNVSTKDVEVQMREVKKRAEALEQRGLELERKLRDCRNDKEKKQMLTEWFSLMHQRQVLSRSDTELVYQMKQQKLEDRQTDVEYELRCLLNKPESDWTQNDREREQQLMDELVAIIEQRNQIVSCLEQDRQRELTEDLLLEGKMNKDFQKEKLKELTKSKQKLKPTKVLKLLNHMSETHKKS